jgi:molybdate transport system substrate-binding protein
VIYKAYKNKQGVLMKKQLAACCTVMLLIAGCSKDDSSSVKKSSEVPRPSVGKPPLVCHIGGTMRPLIAELAAEYEKKTGQKIEINSGGSGELLAHIELQKEGDLYVCHDPFADILMGKRLGVDAWAVGELYPVIIVQKGNPKNIHGLKDLARDDVDVYLTDYNLSTLGRMLSTIFSKAGIDFNELNKKKKINTNKSGGYVANMVKTKNADAGMVWDVVAQLRKDAVDVIPIDKYLPVPGVDAVTSATGKNYFLTPVRVSVATLKCSEHPAAAAKFAEFLASPEVAERFRKAGYRENPDIIGMIYKNGKPVKK